MLARLGGPALKRKTCVGWVALSFNLFCRGTAFPGHINLPADRPKAYDSLSQLERIMEHEFNPYARWPPSISAADYNDELAVQSYLNYFTKQSRWFMTNFETRCLDLGCEYRKTQSIKKMDQETGNCTKGMLATIENVERDWNSDANADVRAAFGFIDDPDELQKALMRFSANVASRIEKLMMLGEITVNRCPKCSRVVRTPSAKQCMWCKHDWH